MMTRTFPTTSHSHSPGKETMHGHIRGFHNTSQSNTPMQNSDVAWLSNKIWKNNSRQRRTKWPANFETSPNKTGIKRRCLWRANNGAARCGGWRKKQSVYISSVCVWCGRDSVCQIPFPLAKEKLPSPTHTPDVLPTSASWGTHTLVFPSSPLAAALILGAQTQSTFSFGPRWLSAAALPDTDAGDSLHAWRTAFFRLQRTYGDPLHTPRNRSLVRSHFESGSSVDSKLRKIDMTSFF